MLVDFCFMMFVEYQRKCYLSDVEVLVFCWDNYLLIYQSFEGDNLDEIVLVMYQFEEDVLFFDFECV